MNKLRIVLITLTAASVITSGILLVCAKNKNDKINNIENYIDIMNIDDRYYLRADDSFYFSNINEHKPVEIFLVGFTDKEEKIINAVLADLNEVFFRMHSNIVLHAHVSLNKPICYNQNVIVCERLEKLSKPNVAGTAFVEDNYIQIYSKIPIDSKNSKGASIFLHEVLHFFGLGDAYLVEDCETASIMHIFENPFRTTFLSTNDIKMLASIHGKFKTQEEITEFLNFTESIGETPTLTFNLLN